MTNTTIFQNVLNLDSTTADKLSRIVSFTAWDNKEEILTVFPFLSDYNSELAKENTDFVCNSPEELAHRKKVFGQRYSVWMSWVRNTYSANTVEVLQEKLAIFSQAKSAANKIIADLQKLEAVSKRGENWVFYTK